VSRHRAWRRLAAVSGVAGAVAVLAPTAALAVRNQEDTEPRVRDLQFRVLDLEPPVLDLAYRTGAIDNSERVEQTPEQTSVVLSADVLFEFDEADLTAEAGQRLDDLADELNELGPRELAVDGHTDSKGDPAYNQDLSLRRAQAVQAALADRLDGDFTFTVEGHGESEPVAPNETDDGADNPDGRALNRRVEITYPT
jgi:outer membrane protein OmpA-like peptidoglycan-associated protein